MRKIEDGLKPGFLNFFSWSTRCNQIWFAFNHQINSQNISLRNISNLLVFNTIYIRNESINYEDKRTFNSRIIFNVIIGWWALKRSPILNCSFARLGRKSSFYIDARRVFNLEISN